MTLATYDECAKCIMNKAGSCCINAAISQGTDKELLTWSVNGCEAAQNAILKRLDEANYFLESISMEAGKEFFFISKEGFNYHLNIDNADNEEEARCFLMNEIMAYGLVETIVKRIGGETL